MRSSFSLAAILIAAVVTSQCGGGDDGGSTGTPTTPGSNTPTVVTVSIVGTNGNKSYVPNPIPTTSGEQVVFKNDDNTTHRIIMDDGSIDFGTLAAGASSAAKGVGAGGTFHCTIHPSMVGSINGAVAPEPPPGSGDGY
jgi:plastocyanin